MTTSFIIFSFILLILSIYEDFGFLLIKNGKQSLIKWVFLIFLLCAPIYGLFLIKDMIFNGGDRSKFPSLKVVSEIPIPEFSFVNQNNEIITNETHKDKIYIADFIFTTCPSICPPMTFNMEYLQEKLSRYDNILYLSHTINPEYDTPEILKEYAKKYESDLGADLSTWNFVTGNKEDIYFFSFFLTLVGFIPKILFTFSSAFEKLDEYFIPPPLPLPPA